MTNSSTMTPLFKKTSKISILRTLLPIIIIILSSNLVLNVACDKSNGKCVAR